MRWMVVVVTVFAGCAFNNNSNPQADAGSGSGSGSGSDLTDGGTPPVMCTLSDLSLTAATLSGCSDAGTSDGLRGYARFSNPVNVAMGPSGNAYVLDFDSSRIRKVDSYRHRHDAVRRQAIQSPVRDDPLRRWPHLRRVR